jgi:hypothetical protein
MSTWEGTERTQLRIYAPLDTGGRAVAKLEKDDPTDLDELMSWAASIVFFGGLAAVSIIGLTFLAISGRPLP